MLEEESQKKDMLIDDYEIMADELDLENETKELQVLELKEKLEMLEKEKHIERGAKDEMSRRFLVIYLEFKRYFYYPQI